MCSSDGHCTLYLIIILVVLLQNDCRSIDRRKISNFCNHQEQTFMGHLISMITIISLPFGFNITPSGEDAINPTSAMYITALRTSYDYHGLNLADRILYASFSWITPHCMAADGNLLSCLLLFIMPADVRLHWNSEPK